MHQWLIACVTLVLISVACTINGMYSFERSRLWTTAGSILLAAACFCVIIAAMYLC